MDVHRRARHLFRVCAHLLARGHFPPALSTRFHWTDMTHNRTKKKMFPLVNTCISTRRGDKKNPNLFLVLTNNICGLIAKLSLTESIFTVNKGLKIHSLNLIVIYLDSLYFHIASCIKNKVCEICVVSGEPFATLKSAGAWIWHWNWRDLLPSGVCKPTLQAAQPSLCNSSVYIVSHGFLQSRDPIPWHYRHNHSHEWHSNAKRQALTFIK